MSTNLMVRFLAIGIVSLVLAGLTVSVGVAGIARDRAPEAALRWFPGDARATADAAFRRLERVKTAAEARPIAEMARAAVARDPTYAPAMRTLAFATLAQGQERAARRLFGISARMSRRDFPTRLWLIEDHVAGNDIRGALVHYDIALRTSEDAKSILFPILARASADRNVAAPLADILAAQPEWARYFMPRLLAQGPDRQNVLFILDRLAARGALPPQDLMQSFVASVGADYDFAAAWRAYALARRGRTGRADILRNGDFESDNVYPPIDWQLSTDTDLAVARELLPASTGAGITFLPATTEKRVVWQLVRLPAGRYHFSGRSGSIAEDAQPYWIIHCAQADAAAPLLNVTIPTSEEARSYSGEFIVPARCPNQVVALVARPSDAASSTRNWIDSIAIIRR